MLSFFFRQKYQTLNKIEISRDNILHNYKYLSSLSKKVKVAAVVKSSGYGHGLVNVARILEEQHPSFFCVDSLYEAYELLKANIKTPILITGYTNPQNLKVKKLPFSYAVYTLDLLEAINKYQPGAGVHIFVDTGMHREGVPLKDLPKFLDALKKYPNIKMEGVMSHLASSKGENDRLFLNQIKEFKKALEIFKKYKIYPKWVHIAATGSLINPQTRPLIIKVSNLVRAGLSLYGFSSSTFDKNLKPSLKLITHLTQIKKIKKGESVGYDGTYKAKKDTIIGVLPIGYFDGVDRALSNKQSLRSLNSELKGFVKISSDFCPIVGRVSMNLTTIDLSKIKNPKTGHKVVVYSDNPMDKNSIENTAKICKKIPYEILVNLADSTKRILV